MFEDKATIQSDQLSSHSSPQDHSTDNHEVFFTGKRGYLFFPPEIRNAIMKLLLQPGNIYMKPQPIMGTRGSKYHQTQYGVQLLATCHQAYQEGHELYYSSNIFHLPSGPHRWSEKLSKQLQPNNLAMIQYVAIDCSVYDLHYFGVQRKIEQATDHMVMDTQDFEPPLSKQDFSELVSELVITYMFEASDTLVDLWKAKFAYARYNFPSLKKLRVTFREAGDPWLFQYFGLEPQLEWGHLPEDQLSGHQRTLDQDPDPDEPFTTIDLSPADLAFAHLDRETPLTEALDRARRQALDYLESDFMYIRGVGESYEREDYMLLAKSTWAIDRMSGRGIRWSTRGGLGM